MSITQLRKQLKDLTATASDAFSGVVRAYEGLESARMILAVSLYDGSVLIGTDARLGRWLDWAQSVCPGESDSSLYRLANAGAVAKVVGDVGRASERHLAPFYKILKGASTEDERTAAENVVRESWSSLQPENGKVPTEDAITELVDSITSGTRGPKKGAKGSKSAKGQKGSTPDAPADDDPAAREVASKDVARTTARLVDAGADIDTVRLVMSATVGLCEKHGISVMFAVCKQIAADAKAAAKVKVAA